MFSIFPEAGSSFPDAGKASSQQADASGSRHFSDQKSDLHSDAGSPQLRDALAVKAAGPHAAQTRENATKTRKRDSRKRDSRLAAVHNDLQGHR